MKKIFWQKDLFLYISVDNEMNMSNKTKIFKALSDFNRLRILKALQSRILCVCEIRGLLNLANSTVSQHLKILKDAGFIIESKSGKWVNYIINPTPSDTRIGAILSSLDFWIDDEDTIIKDKKVIKHLCRDELCKT
jgi:ArsR family transcriptional regulator